MIDIATALIELLKIWNGRKTQKEKLANYLDAISSDCSSAVSKLRSNQVPRVEGKALALIVNRADEIAVMMEGREPKIFEFFSNEVLDLGNVLRSADFYIDGRPRSTKHHRARASELKLRTQLDQEGAVPSNFMSPSLVEGCCEKLESVEGQARAFATILRN